jgi:plasmid replication initiation protein
MNELLLKPNELINVISELDLSRNARHLFNYFLRHAQKKIKFENYQGNTFTINYSELNKLADINPESVEVMKNSLRHLMRPVVITDTKTEFEAIVPVTYVTIDKQTGDYVFRLEEKVIDLLRQTDYFTKLNLKEFNIFKSKHSIVIFEYLKRYENIGRIPKIEIVKLRQMTNTQNKYANFKHFEQYVLDVATKEINTLTNYNVSYELIKIATSRRPKVNEIQFHFAKKSASSGIDQDVTEVAQKTAQNVAKNEDLHVKNNSLRPNAHAFDQLYLDFCRKFKDLSVQDYELALNTYELSTLHQFLNDMQKYSTLSSDKFLSYLEDRTSKGWQNYLMKKAKTPDEDIANMMNMLRPRKK